MLALREDLNWLQIAPDQSATLGRNGLQVAVRQMVKSVRFELSKDNSHFRILGPDTPYHQLDPYLRRGLIDIGASVPTGDITWHRETRAHFDLTFEDSWCGAFIAEALKPQPDTVPLVLLHLDDHTDMMDTLLAMDAGRAFDPATGAVFRAGDPASWDGAIRSGAISIGNFVTPLFLLDRTVHVRHLGNRDASACLGHTARIATIRYDVAPQYEFVRVVLEDEACDADPGHTVSTANAVGPLLEDLPDGVVMVHIDLDYFINDFNGNAYEGDFVPDPEARNVAMEKLDRFFGALSAHRVRVARWIVGISPGFCSGLHWKWLLDEIEWRIVALRRACR